MFYYHRAVTGTLLLFAGILLPQAEGFSNVGPRPQTDELSKSSAFVVPTTTRSSFTICHATRFKGVKMPSFNTKKSVASTTPEPETSQKSLGNFKNVLDRVNQSVSQIATRGNKQQQEVVKTPPKPKGPVERLASTFQRGASVRSVPEPSTDESTSANDATPAFLKRVKSVLASTSSTDATVINNKKEIQTPVAKVPKSMEQMQTQVEALQGDLQQTVQERKQRVMVKWNDLQKVISESTAEIKTTVEDTVKTTQQVVNEVKAIPQRVQETKANDAAAMKAAQEQMSKKSPSSADLWKDFSVDAMSKTGDFMQWAAKEAAEVASQAVAVSKEVATELSAVDDDVAVMELQSTPTATTSQIEDEVVEALMAAEAELKALNAPTIEESSSAVSSMSTTPVAKKTEDTMFELEVEEALLAAEAALGDLNDSAASAVTPTPVMKKTEEVPSEVEETPLAAEAALGDLNVNSASKM